jgi:hypothetical protein
MTTQVRRRPVGDASGLDLLLLGDELVLHRFARALAEDWRCMGLPTAPRKSDAGDAGPSG